MPNGEADFTKDLVGKAVGRLLERYKNKPIITALVTSYVSELVEIRDAIKEVQLARDARTAYGIYEDIIGKIIGEARNAANDEAYRLLINTKIAVNKSSGRASDFETIWELLGNDPTQLRLTETPPAAGIITSIAPITNVFLSNVEMVDVLTRIFFRGKVNAAGVRLTFIYATDPHSFQFKHLPSASDPTKSYSDSSSPATLTYGKLASILA